MSWEPEKTLGGYQINRAARLLGRVTDILLKPLGLAAGQVPILAVLRDGSELSQTALARLVQIEQPTMAATLTRMERDGLIARQPDPSDGRSSLIRLTPAALEKLPTMQTIIASGREEMLAGIDAAERQLLADLMMRVIANLEAITKKL